MSRDAITVRAEQPDDFEAIDEIVSAAFLAEFGTTTEVALIRTMRERGELVPELTLVAEDHGCVVGHIAFSEVTVDGHSMGGLGLAPVSVAPNVQRSGIGSLLISTALERAEHDGWRFVVLLGHPSYYPRFGFASGSCVGPHGGLRRSRRMDGPVPRRRARSVRTRPLLLVVRRLRSGCVGEGQQPAHPVVVADE